MRMGLWTGALAVSCLIGGRSVLAQSEPIPKPESGDKKAAHVAPHEHENEGPRHHPMRPDILRAQKVTWIGVAVSPVPPVAEHQLKLPLGVGLVVDEVAPDSPAAKAGLQEYDVLHKLEDQLLVNPEQLATLIRMHKSGDEVTLTVIREGKPTEVKATLGEYNAPPMMPRMHPFFGHGPMMGPGDEGRGPRPPVPPAGEQGMQFQNQIKLQHLPGMDLPKIELQFDGNQPQIVLKDGAGHTLFSKSLDFQFDIGKGPVNVHVQLDAKADHPHEQEDGGPKPHHAPDDHQ